MHQKMGDGVSWDEPELLNLNVNETIMNRLSRITIDPEICHGKPSIRGMRWPVEVILGMLGSGMTTEQIIEDHPELEKEDVLASLDYIMN